MESLEYTMQAYHVIWNIINRCRMVVIPDYTFQYHVIHAASFLELSNQNHDEYWHIQATVYVYGYELLGSTPN